jgi:hypothetical protein
MTNIAPLQEMNESMLAEDIHLFGIKPKVQRVTWAFGANDYLFGDRHIVTPNEPNGVVINYYLKNKAADKVKLTVTDPYGKELASFNGPTNAGINTLIWDMRPAGPRREGPGPGAGLGARSRDVLSQWIPPGEYVVVLEVGDKKFTQKARVTKTIGWSIGPFPQVIRYLP